MPEDEEKHQACSEGDAKYWTPTDGDGSPAGCLKVRIKKPGQCLTQQQPLCWPVFPSTPPLRPSPSVDFIHPILASGGAEPQGVLRAPSKSHPQHSVSTVDLGGSQCPCLRGDIGERAVLPSGE
ncbi:hypothetical protein EYF80_034046 [Liparis tanakae]|uniref:Uncharacterized protein n=1 Tax=Liparis tanakae TaxID=230148 RepID=A0A4Z2GQK3_9TELE|nr:hypothetical protein EYF80_034046 [Liparis tanakae]